MSKKVSEMTVKEFLEESKKKGANVVLEDPNFGLLQVLLKEGFSEKEANQMKMKRAWDFYWDSISNSSNQIFSQIYRGVEEDSERASLLKPYFENMKKQLEEMNKELEDQEKSD